METSKGAAWGRGRDRLLLRQRVTTGGRRRGATHHAEALGPVPFPADPAQRPLVCEGQRREHVAEDRLRHPCPSAGGARWRTGPRTAQLRPPQAAPPPGRLLQAPRRLRLGLYHKSPGVPGPRPPRRAHKERSSRLEL